MRFILGLLFALGCAVLPLHAETVVAGMNQNRIAITANFDGSEILIFGAIKRETAIPADEALGVIITVAGPSKPVVVRRKEKRLGIWINVDAVEIDLAPSFYAVATSDIWSSVISDTEDLRYRVSVPRAIRSVGAPMNVTDAGAFTDAVIRIRAANGLYSLEEGAVELSEDTLFNTAITLPSNLTEGTYVARFFLTRGGRVVDVHQTEIEVQKVGLERFLYSLAHEQPLIYGLLSLFIAIVAGWGASAIFRYFKS
ncbi:MAG: TIGR02186 family protein [Albidovulum sp.]